LREDSVARTAGAETPAADPVQRRDIGGRGIGGAGAGDDRGIHRRDSRRDDRECEHDPCPRPESPAHQVGGGRLGTGEAGETEAAQHGPGGEQVKRGDERDRDDQRPEHAALAVLHFGREGCRLGPAAIGEQDEDETVSEAAETRRGWRAGIERRRALEYKPGSGRGERHEARDQDNDERAVAGLAGREQLDRCEQEDAGKGIDRRAVGAEINDAVQVVADDEAEQRDGPGIDDGEACPGEKKGEPLAPGALEEMIVAARMGEGGGELRIAEGAGERDQPAGDPEQVDHLFGAGIGGDQCRRFEDAGADHHAENDGDDVAGRQAADGCMGCARFRRHQASARPSAVSHPLSRPARTSDFMPGSKRLPGTARAAQSAAVVQPSCIAAAAAAPSAVISR